MPVGLYMHLYRSELNTSKITHCLYLTECSKFPKNKCDTLRQTNLALFNRRQEMLLMPKISA